MQAADWVEASEGPDPCEGLAPLELLEALVELLAPPAWASMANCKGESIALFFPESGCSVGAGRAICARCPVRAECLRFAVDEGLTDGCYGGLSGRERRQVTAPGVRGVARPGS